MKENLLRVKIRDYFKLLAKNSLGYSMFFEILHFATIFFIICL